MTDPSQVLARIAAQVSAIEEQIQALHPRRVLHQLDPNASFEDTLQEKLRPAETPPLSDQVEQWVPLIRQYARRAGVDPALVQAVMQVESAGLPHSLSPKGAAGLMQLMPDTAAALGVEDRFDPGQSIRGGSQYLRAMLDRFGDVTLALAAYNAGPEAVERHGGVPPYAETQDYVRRVLSEARRLEAAG